MSELNDWFLSLPEARQAVLRDDKWFLAEAAFAAGKAARAQPAQAGQGTKVKEPHFAPQEAITEDGWTEWVCPKPKGYLAQCCDCGLVHEIDTRVAKYEPRPSENFEVVTDPDLQVQWRVRRRDDLRQEIWEIPAFEPDQTPDLEAGKSRFYSAQAGQVLTDEKLWEMWVESPSDVLRFARAIEQAVMAKWVPMPTRRVTYTCPACHFSLERAE